MDFTNIRTETNDSRMKAHSSPKLVFPLRTLFIPDDNETERINKPAPLLQTSEVQLHPLYNSVEAMAPPRFFHFSDSLPSRAEIKCFSDYVMTKDEVREAVIQFANEHVLYGKDRIRNIEIKEVSMFHAFHYTLKTFTESREAKSIKKPYCGGIVDTAANGTPPELWDIKQIPPKMFEYAYRKSEIPHTASVSLCKICDGVRRIKCSGCRGSSNLSCKKCRGRMNLFTTEMCPDCGGKSSSCTQCHGVGKINCRTCDGEGRLKHFKQLTTTWRNYEDDVLINQTTVPDKLIRNQRGHTIFQERLHIVSPIMHFPHEDVNHVSNTLISKHRQAFPNEHIIQQAHQVQVIPVAQIQYCRKEKCEQFFVYGLEKKLYFPDYKRMLSPLGCVISKCLHR